MAEQSLHIGNKNQVSMFRSRSQAGREIPSYQRLYNFPGLRSSPLDLLRIYFTVRTTLQWVIHLHSKGGHKCTLSNLHSRI